MTDEEMRRLSEDLVVKRRRAAKMNWYGHHHQNGFDVQQHMDYLERRFSDDEIALLVLEADRLEEEEWKPRPKTDKRFLEFLKDPLLEI